MPSLSAETVDRLMRACMHTDAEMANGPPDDVAVGQGVVRSYGFHPGRLAAHRAEIDALLAELPEAFQPEERGGGGGGSFLNLCTDRTGRQWTGLHQTMECLMSLGTAAGALRVLVPRERWAALPGGMPYLVVERPPRAD